MEKNIYKIVITFCFLVSGLVIVSAQESTRSLPVSKINQSPIFLPENREFAQTIYEEARAVASSSDYTLTDDFWAGVLLQEKNTKEITRRLDMIISLLRK